MAKSLLCKNSSQLRKSYLNIKDHSLKRLWRTPWNSNSLIMNVNPVKNLNSMRKRNSPVFFNSHKQLCKPQKNINCPLKRRWRDNNHISKNLWSLCKWLNKLQSLLSLNSSSIHIHNNLTKSKRHRKYYKTSSHKSKKKKYRKRRFCSPLETKIIK